MRRGWSACAVAVVSLAVPPAARGGQQGASAADGGDPHAAGAAAAAPAAARRPRGHAEGRHDQARRPGRRDAQGDRRSEAAASTTSATGVRILREKADDTNVRLSTVSQEIEAMRQAIASMPRRSVASPSPTPAPTPTGWRRATAGGVRPTGARQRPAPPPTSRRSGCSTTRTTTTPPASYDLAIQGFEAYIRHVPDVADSADDAQCNIGNSLYRQPASAPRRSTRSRR